MSTGCQRSTRFIIDKDKDIVRNAYRDLPQGAVLISPLLYDIYTNEIVEGLSAKIKQLQFANDIVVYCDVNDRASRFRLLEEAVTTLKTISVGP